jgi:translation initiation factor IF-3
VADNYRVGRRIRVPEVRVIGADGSQVGIVPTHEALRMAEEQGLDLVEVSPRAVPPVCRIMDFGRFKYQESKKEKASRKHQSTVVLKEIKFRPKTDKHDLDFKLKHIRRFLGEGNKVRLMIVFRGREIVHPETGQAMLDLVSKEVADLSLIEQKASMEGRRMVMVLGPRTGVIRSASAAASSQPQTAPSSAVRGAPSTGAEPSGPTPPPDASKP